MDEPLSRVANVEDLHRLRSDVPDPVLTFADSETSSYTPLLLQNIIRLYFQDSPANEEHWEWLFRLMQAINQSYEFDIKILNIETASKYGSMMAFLLKQSDIHLHNSPPQWWNMTKNITQFILKLSSKGFNMKNVLLKYVCENLLAIISIKDFPVAYVCYICSCLNACLSGADPTLKRKLLKRHSEYINLIPSLLTSCGDYQTQIVLVKNLVHWKFDNMEQDVQNISSAWFSDFGLDSAYSQFHKLTPGDLFHDRCREFLNNINEINRRVVSIECLKLLIGDIKVFDVNETEKNDKLWMDFNEGSNTLTVYCEITNLLLDPISQESTWETIYINIDDIKIGNLKKYRDHWKIILVLAKPLKLNELLTTTKLKQFLYLTIFLSDEYVKCLQKSEILSRILEIEEHQQEHLSFYDTHKENTMAFQNVKKDNEKISYLISYPSTNINGDLFVTSGNGYGTSRRRYLNLNLSYTTICVQKQGTTLTSDVNQDFLKNKEMQNSEAESENKPNIPRILQKSRLSNKAKNVLKENNEIQNCDGLISELKNNQCNILADLQNYEALKNITPKTKNVKRKLFSPNDYDSDCLHNGHGFSNMSKKTVSKKSVDLHNFGASYTDINKDKREIKKTIRGKVIRKQTNVKYTSFNALRNSLNADNKKCLEKTFNSRTSVEKHADVYQFNASSNSSELNNTKKNKNALLKKKKQYERKTLPLFDMYKDNLLLKESVTKDNFNERKIRILPRRSSVKPNYCDDIIYEFEKNSPKLMIMQPNIISDLNNSTKESGIIQIVDKTPVVDNSVQEIYIKQTNHAMEKMQVDDIPNSDSNACQNQKEGTNAKNKPSMLMERGVSPIELTNAPTNMSENHEIESIMRTSHSKTVELHMNNNKNSTQEDIAIWLKDFLSENDKIKNIVSNKQGPSKESNTCKKCNTALNDSVRSWNTNILQKTKEKINWEIQKTKNDYIKIYDNFKNQAVHLIMEMKAFHLQLENLMQDLEFKLNLEFEALKQHVENIAAEKEFPEEAEMP